MLYKDKGKAGYMAPAPSNEGLYSAIYTELAGKLGCKLIIERFPKKRTLLHIEHGKADLYPSTGFDEKRSKFMHYIANGLYRYEPYFGLAPGYVPELTDISQINEYGLTWVFEAGSTTINNANALGTKSQQIVGLTDARAIEILKKEGALHFIE